MSRRKPTTDGEMPSIIEELVIYDKPNKPVVPQEIFPKTALFNVGQGDIVLTRARDSSSPNPNAPSEVSITKTTKERKVKNEPEEELEEEEEEILEEESEYEELNESNVHVKSETFMDNEIFTEDESSEVEESIENISKEISKLKTQPQPKQTIKKTNKTPQPEEDRNKKQKVAPKNSSPFKKPRGRPRKSESTQKPQKTSILNFVIKQSKNNEIDLVESQRNETSNSTRQQRLRRRPKKYDSEEVILGLTYSDEDEDEIVADPPSKKKKVYTTLTVVPLYEESSTKTQPSSEVNNVEDLLDEAQEQVRTLNEVEAELQNLVEGAKKIAKKPDQQRKITDMFEKKIKREAEEDSDDLADVAQEEEYESDGDSRTEWVPEEYAQYKQQHSMKVQQLKMHKCKFCGKGFNSYYSVRKHRALEHDDVGRDLKESTYEVSDTGEEGQEGDGDSEDEDRGEWMPQDYAEYKLKHNMNKMKRSQWYKCKICCEIFSNYYKLSKHRSVEHENKQNPYECKQCAAKFGDVDSLTAHIRGHQGKDPYKCRKCDKGFNTKAELDNHLPIHVLKKAPTPVKRYRCDLCSKEFSKLCDIERHTRVHTGEKPCECNICHKRFQQSHNLSKHLLTHLHVKPFQCEICNKKFGRIDVLNRHLLTHSLEKPFKCDICNKGFIRQIQLIKHLNKIHPDVDLNMVRLDQVTDEVTVTAIH